MYFVWKREQANILWTQQKVGIQQNSSFHVFFSPLFTSIHGCCTVFSTSIQRSFHFFIQSCHTVQLPVKRKAGQPHQESIHGFIQTVVKQLRSCWLHSWVECAQFLPKDKRSVLYLWLSDAYCGWCPLCPPVGVPASPAKCPLSRSAPTRVEQAQAAQAHHHGRDQRTSRRARPRWPIKGFSPESPSKNHESQNFKWLCQFSIKIWEIVHCLIFAGKNLNFFCSDLVW